MKVFLSIITLILASLLYPVLTRDKADPDTMYLEAVLAYQQEDYKTALTYFDRLYALDPHDVSYYREYANALLILNPDNSRLPALMTTLHAAPERDIGVWLLFARYEQVVHNVDAAARYYDEALALATPHTPLYEAIKEQRENLWTSGTSPSLPSSKD